jgi:hypothetical protein
MSGSLIKLDEVEVTSPTASVTLGDSDWDNSFDVYQVIVANAKVNTDDALSMRILASGSAQTGTNYQDFKTYLKSDTSIAEIAGTGRTQVDITATIDSGISGANGNGIFYLFSFNNASEYSYVTIESNHLQYNDDAGRGFQGGFIHTSAEANDGVLIKTNGGNNITSGIFSLYALRN